jgi:catalase
LSLALAVGGCSVEQVKAQFHVLETLPHRLAKGMFTPGKTYQAWIRFSNGSSDPTRPDIKKDARGMAIKVFGALPVRYGFRP